MALPGVTSILTDNGLQFARQVDLGDSIVVLGTAEKGPLNQPVAVASPSQARKVFGSYGSGSLVRGLYESFGASAAVKDLRGCRIGNATKATIGFAESTGTAGGVEYDEPTYEVGGAELIQDAFTLTAKKEGSVYNLASIRLDYVAGTRSVVVYNPVTGIESYFSYESDPNASATVHDVAELVDAINADSNLNEDFIAEMKDLETQFEVDLTYADASSTYDTGVAISGDIVRVTLQERLDTSVVGGSPLPTGVHDVETLYGDYNANFPTVGNKILTVTSVYQVDKEVGYLLESKGIGSLTLPGVPIKTSSEHTYLGNVAGDTWTSAKAKQKYTYAYIGSVESTDVQSYAWSAVGEIDPTTFHLYKSQAGVVSEIASTDFDDTSLDCTAGAQVLTFDSTSVVPDPGTLLLVSYTSLEVDLAEIATRSACLATADWQNYFVSGSTITFGAAPPSDMYISFKFKNEFAIGGEVILEDASTGKFMFPATTKSPKDDIEASTFAAPVTFGFAYSYQPEWIALGASAVSLKGGSDGIVMSKYAQYDALQDAYDNLENYEADYYVPMAAYLDDVKQSYNVETGELETMNAGFHTQLDSFLQSLSSGVSESRGIIGVKPALTADLAGVRAWVEGLTVVSSSDSTRAANVYAAFNSKFVSVVAAEPVLSNTEVTLPYSTTGEALYAGLAAGLKPGSAPTNKRLDNVMQLRYVLSRQQLSDLTDARYVTFRAGGGALPGYVVTDGVTAAAPGSDYVRMSTVAQVFAAMKVVRQVAQPFIGEGNDNIGRMALDTAIRRGLQAMVSARNLADFAFSITSSLQDQVNGIVDVELILVPLFEMRQIRVTVRIRASL